jgi:biotin transport system substrate-specific component
MLTHAGTGTILDRSLADSAFAVPARIAVIALAVVLTAAAAQFTMPLPGTDVPFTLTPLVVLLAGAVLGSRSGALSQVLYLAAGAAGLEVFAPDPRLPLGALRLLGPTAGYLLSYPIAAWVCGRLAERGWDRRYLTSLAAMLAGLSVIYAGGLAWRLTWLRSIDLAVATSILPFVVPDIVKAGLAAAILPQAWRFAGVRRDR